MEKETQRRDRLKPEERAEGFVFFSRKDALLAESERKKVDYLEAHIDYTRPEAVLIVYKKAIEERIFKTPVGLVYLKRLQDFLLGQESILAEDVPPIVLYQYYDSEVRKNTNPARKRVQPSARTERNSPVLPISILLNILLVIAILAMFVISFNADQPNIFNYERALTDKYAGWEQELSQREQAVKEKELELHIEEGISQF